MSEFPKPKPLKVISLYPSYAEDEKLGGLVGNIDTYLIDKEGNLYFTVFSIGDFILTMHERELELLKKRMKGEEIQIIPVGEHKQHFKMDGEN